MQPEPEQPSTSGPAEPVAASAPAQGVHDASIVSLETKTAEIDSVAKVPQERRSPHVVDKKPSAIVAHLILTVGALLPMALAHWVDAFTFLGFRLSTKTYHYGEITKTVLYSRDAPLNLLISALPFLLSGLAASIYAGRQNGREMRLGGPILALGQLLIFLGDIDFRPGLFFTDLSIVRDGFALVIPGALFVSGAIMLTWSCSFAGSLAGAAIIEGITNKERCFSCNERFTKKLHVAECPHCGVDLAKKGIAWPYVLVGTLATAVVFTFVVKGLGETLDFSYTCNPTRLNSTCRKLVSEARNDASTSWTFYGYVDRENPERNFLTLLHPWKYFASASGLMLIAPAVLAARLRFGQQSYSAIATMILNILVCGTLGIVLLSGKGSEGAFMLLFRMHILMGAGWCVVGFIGVAIGQKLRGKRDMDSLFDDMPASSKHPGYR